MIRWPLVVFAFCVGAIPVAAQTPAEAASAPPIRRWLDVQNLHLSSRFRWVESNTGQITSSTLQWQPNIRARFLIDPEAKYSVHVGAFSGNQFVSSWNNTGGGAGAFASDFNVKQLFVSAAPIRALEFQAGGLYMLRGENTEITTYDNDAYIVGERVLVTRPQGWFAQFAATIGHIGDYRTPNVFERFDSMDDINYGQILLSARATDRINFSADYTYEDSRDLLREGVTVRLPEKMLPLTAIKAEAYQRLSEVTGEGFNVAGDLRITRALTITAGVTHIDQNYLIPGYMSPNADRYERGTRVYSFGAYAIARELSVGYFVGEAFNIDFDIPNEHRWEILVTFNPTALLKAKGIF
jgi:hypothetical protein